MPLFDFECDNCKERTEKIISYRESENISEECPSCKKGQLKKLPVSSFNFKLKGNWFKNTGAY